MFSFHKSLECDDDYKYVEKFFRKIAERKRLGLDVIDPVRPLNFIPGQIPENEYTRFYREKNKMIFLSLSECNSFLTKLIDRKKCIEKDKLYYAQEHQKNKEVLAEIEQILQTYLARIVNFFDSWSFKSSWCEALRAKKNQAKEIYFDTRASYKAKKRELKIIEEAIVYCRDLIKQREQENFCTFAQRIYKGEKNVELTEDAKNSPLIQAVQQHVQECGTVHTATFSLNEKTYAALKNFSVQVPKIREIQYEGNRGQLYVYGELVDSLNKIGDIPNTLLSTRQLLKQAVLFNDSGRTLVCEHRLDQALSAKLACDALIDYVKTIEDLGLKETIEENTLVLVMPSDISYPCATGLLYALAHPEEAYDYIKNIFDRFCFAENHYNAEVQKDAEYTTQALGRTAVMGDEYMQIINTYREKNKLAFQSLSECKESLGKLERRKKQVERELKNCCQEIQTCKDTANQKALHAAEISKKEKLSEYKVIKETIVNCKYIISQREQESFGDIAQRIYKGEQNVELSKDAKNSALIRSVQQHIQEFGALHKEVFSLNDQTYNVLENLGAKVPETCLIEFEGNRVQLHVYGELINSLNNMGSVNLARLEVQQLLKQAVIINNNARKLVGEHKLNQALSAKLVCDALVNYAKTVGDLGIAIEEEIFKDILKYLVGATTYPEETLTYIKTKLNQATLAASSYITEKYKEAE
jgi:hypothetical protein